jgi:transcriptional regulator with XRE-family HTH domain
MSEGQAPQGEAPKPPKKSPAQKRAEAAADREGWTQEAIDAAILANGGIPKGSNDDEPKTGRKPKYKTIDLERVEMYAAGGLTKKEIAAAVGIAESTLYQYEIDHPEFSKAIASGRSILAGRAEISLHKSGAGHYAMEEKLHYDQQVGKWARETTLKYYPPDTKANLAILQHQETGSWRPKAEVEHSFPEPLVIKSLATKDTIEALGLEKPAG